MTINDSGSAVDSAPATETVLVTGGSGFLAAHCILQLLNAGYRVRTTVRTLAREADVRGMLKTGGAKSGGALAFVAADLVSDQGWREAVTGCKFVLHVASPFPPGAPDHEDELIVPARDGALRVLRASRDAGVARVVMTSSFAAIGYSRKPVDHLYTEEDWTDSNDDNSAYVKSKTIAERDAWNFMETAAGDLELSVVNPVGIFGPILGPDLSSSVQLIKGLLDGAMPAIPPLSFSVVDVRDVAELHLRAMTNPAASGERFLAAAGKPMTMHEIASTLNENLGREAARMSPGQRPEWLVRLAALVDAAPKQIVPPLAKQISSLKARQLLGWSPRTNAEAVVATAESLIRLDLLNK